MARTEDEESAPRNNSGADRTNKARKKKSKTHVHIGPNARAHSAGLAFCPVCDADKILRLTDKEREAERASKEPAFRKSR